MKKFLVIAVCAALVSTACRKTRTCNCTTTDTDNQTVSNNFPNSTPTNTVIVTTTTNKTTTDSQKSDNFREVTNCNSGKDDYTKVNTSTTGTFVVTQTDVHSVDISCTLN
jgi:hypothetical protein